jgi:hypothetical protein
VVMYVNIYLLCFSAGTLTMFAYVIPLELTMGMSVICHRLYVRQLYLANFFFWRGQICLTFFYDLAYA